MSAPATQSPTRTAYRIRANQLEACNCRHGCNCQFGGGPNEGACEFLMALDVTDGHFGDVDLTGMRIAVAKGASKRIVDLLVSSGVRMEVWRLPAELAEPRLGPTLAPDDLLDFHLILEGDDWFSDLEDLVRRSMPS